MRFSPSRSVELPIYDVHVWYVSLECWRSRLECLRKLLAVEERRTLERYRRESDVHRRIVSRGVLRLVLGRQLRVDPQSIRFSYSRRGKPSVSGLEFNVAHSGDLVLIATHALPVGIDVEQISSASSIEALGATCFTSRERSMARQAGCDNCLWQLWVRKEAWLKALGVGVSISPAAIDVANPATPLLASYLGCPRISNHRVIDLPVAEGYRAACAIAGPPCRTVLQQVQPPPACSDWGELGCGDDSEDCDPPPGGLGASAGALIL